MAPASPPSFICCKRPCNCPQINRYRKHAVLLPVRVPLFNAGHVHWRPSQKELAPEPCRDCPRNGAVAEKAPARGNRTQVTACTSHYLPFVQATAVVFMLFFFLCHRFLLHFFFYFPPPPPPPPWPQLGYPVTYFFSRRAACLRDLASSTASSSPAYRRIYRVAAQASCARPILWHSLSASRSWSTRAYIISNFYPTSS